MSNVKSAMLTLHLFDACIRPIILYGSEVWGSNFNNLNLLDFTKKSEHVHLKCCKWILGVSKKCSNLGTLGELGRCPMSVFVKLNMIKYWAHLETLPKERLVKMVYEHAKNNNYNVWYSSVKHTLANLQIDISTIKLTDSLSKRAFTKGVEKS